MVGFAVFVGVDVNVSVMTGVLVGVRDGKICSPTVNEKIFGVLPSPMPIIALTEIL